MDFEHESEAAANCKLKIAMVKPEGASCYHHHSAPRCRRAPVPGRSKIRPELALHAAVRQRCCARGRALSGGSVKMHSKPDAHPGRRPAYVRGYQFGVHTNCGGRGCEVRLTSHH